jgi:hypothetical protein
MGYVVINSRLRMINTMQKQAVCTAAISATPRARTCQS